MFQPLSESYIYAVAEASIDGHIYETDEERAVREGYVYQPDDLPWVRRLLDTLGQALATIGCSIVNTLRQYGALRKRWPVTG